MQFLIALALLAAPAFADLSKDLPKETDAKTDARNDSCARLSVAAKSGRAIAPDDEAIAACSAGNHTVCVLTQRFLDENPSTKGLLTACTGPQEVATSLTERALAVCKIGMCALNCMTNGLPTAPSITDVSMPAIIRPGSPGGGGIISK